MPPSYTVNNIILPEHWGRDHWSTLLYVESRLVDDKYYMRIDPRMRTNRVHFRVLQEAAARPSQSAQVMSTDQGSRLSDNQVVVGHDDWCCLQDMFQAGMFEGELDVGVQIKLTGLGHKVCAALRKFKADGGSTATWKTPEILLMPKLAYLAGHDALELPVGTDLDLLVAMNVMGWQLESPQEGYVIVVEPIGDNDCTRRTILEPDSSNWAPSRDWNHMQEVILAMEQDGYRYFSIKQLSGGEDQEASWRAKFNCGFGPCEAHGNPHDVGHGGEATSVSAPLSVCLAALAAKYAEANFKKEAQANAN